MRAWKDVAVLQKTRSTKGKFVARCAADFPFIPEIGSEVAFVPPQTDLPRRGRVVSVRYIDGATYEVGFDSVTDESMAHALLGCHCLVRRDGIDESAFEEQPAAWVGWRVVEANGDAVGDVVSIIDNPGQALLEVEREGGRLAYVPIVDEFVQGVDVQGRVVVVDLPVGLLDL